MADDFRVGVVIPATQDRLLNLAGVLDALDSQTVRPKQIKIVCDGWEPTMEVGDLYYYETQVENTEVITIPKYEPSQGMDQPRNVGAKALTGCNYVWFLDSDCLPIETCLEEYKKAWRRHPDIDRILIGPYDWMAEGIHEPQLKLYNDPRWEMFREFDSSVVKTNDLGMGLGCLSGNLMWPLEQFKQIGGFWNEIHMGRCEDGELGLRAASLGVPMSVVREARAFHMGHEINYELVEQKNSRDVPLLHERHGKVEETGLKVVNEDGKRLNYVCEDCGEEFNTLMYWEHKCHH